MEHFFIVTNDGKDTQFVVTGQVKALLESAGKVCTLCKKDADKKIIKETGALLKRLERWKAVISRSWGSIWELSAI